ncbi:MAG TPA: hypothetical protein DEG17_08200 [Cyanobacteria bacterium UBA11149]|nr:hypothetical protein [Cyanobacteria bacterium UBA11367]HBE59666.1 hypothetical protein [Cyanobacteria bacterium UBA11366]HBK66036.1 hypothetical protein [Cyanobacteria bacterium UBA11166]HBR72585.1 hypothetical protein [Cyanobacteria bacterium UBA11159]HBS68780.1 hypothetical protein [Cyanobacteria bacterium UBA11153]HBW88841.1 hypothetical protein [Cyanobacteria bacterium UBA11149]HCA95782.1 hypothetical protein [Cyanobacteria bacterium UBA9226]
MGFGLSRFLVEAAIGVFILFSHISDRGGWEARFVKVSWKGDMANLFAFIIDSTVEVGSGCKNGLT